jgi:ribosomal protein S18 acetylase RimI-like enzyme
MQIDISGNPDWIDIDRVWCFLRDEAYWSLGIPRDVVQRAVANSLVWGAYANESSAKAPSGRSQVGFLRVVSDRATFAYLCDVFVLPEWRGRGIAHRLLAAAHAHPDLQGLRRWLLFTRDAHALYARAGFTPLANPLRGMERLDSDVYIRALTRQPGIDLSGELR